ncbi:MAG TPA: AraC family transcriptional regulator [Chloroflexota bacterium]|nr:AraC family transcriptional regulator [Chloroflexota bacterium]
MIASREARPSRKTGDVLAEVLDVSRVGGTISGRLYLRSPWSVAFDEEPECGYFHLVSKGSCWLDATATGEPIRLDQGDVVLLPHGNGHVLSDAPGRHPVPVLELLGDCEPGPAVELHHGGGGPESILLSGAYHFEPGAPHPVLAYLPPVLHIGASLAGIEAAVAPLHSALRLLSVEMTERRPGYRAVAERLVDILLIYMLRFWLESRSDEVEGWLAALRDPRLGEAICCIHRDLSQPWTVASLARAAGMSRSAFARDFSALTGEPPLAYLTRQRIEIAARLLRSGDAPLEAIAERVGYESEYSFSKAFKRLMGVAPGRFRARERLRRQPGRGGGGPTAGTPTRSHP